MRINQEIQSEKFENEFQKSLVNLIFTYSWANQNIKALLAPYDITQQQFNVLRILRGQYPQPCKIKLVKSRILDKMSDVSRIVERLLQKQLLVKAENIRDKRATNILISEKGLALLTKLDMEVDFSKFIRPNITETEAKQLNELLDKFRG
ncbi:MAG: MarR family transcriptional regulator [Pedobacter sp.]|nr:MAG: MarR family transcriptional regulator [Pedobacter sp.]